MRLCGSGLGVGRTAVVMLVSTLALVGCPEDESGDSGSDILVVEPGDDGGVDGAGGTVDDSGPPDARDVDDGIEPDTGPGPDVGPDGPVPDEGPPPDMFPGTEVDSCQDACDRYASCDALAETFGDEQSCLARCERLTRGDRRPDAWWSCLGLEGCNLLHLCRVPDPEPLTCDEVCGRADACGVAVPDCGSACDEAGEPFQHCGEALVGDCREAEFMGCLADDVYPQCGASCASAVACNVVLEEGCLLECVGALADADPLFSLRARQQNSCIARAQADCLAVDLCVNPPEPGMGGVNAAQFCQEYDRCNLDQQLGPCQQAIDRFGLGPAFFACAVAQTRNGCPRDVGQLLQMCQNGGPDPRLGECTRVCEGQGVCGLLDADDPLSRQACSQACIGGQNADPDDVERASSALECVNVDRCPALVDCLDESGPAGECAAHCARLADCALGGEGCEAACDAGWPRDRQAAYRACVAGAEACEDVTACEVAPGAPCEAFCAHAVECGVAAAPRCEASCDDLHFADPVREILYDACVLSAPLCRADNANDHGAASCRDRPDFGLACLGYCRFVSPECGGERDLGACLRDCGRGFVGDDGLSIRVARDCLQDQAADAECGALDVCIPDDLDADCPGYCEGARACAIERADCEQVCAGDPLARLRVLQQAACLEDAGEACDDVRACLIPVVDVPDVVRPVDEAALCAAWNRCGYDEFFGPCPQVLPGFVPTEEGRRCVFDLIAGACPRDVEAILQCRAGGVPQGSPIAAECAALCEARAFCGDEAAEDQAACRRACEARLDPNERDAAARLAPRLACAGAWSCPDLDDCLDNSAPEAVCARHCGQLAECGAVANADACAADCDDGFGRLRHFAWRDCVGRAARCPDVAACELAQGVPCDEACLARAECGDAAPTCADDCDDRHFAEPLDTALEVACILGADGCEGDDSVAACLVDPGAGARTCLGYCRGVTECEDGAEGSLIDCLNGCVGGFRDRNGLRFAASAGCLSAVLPNAECRVVLACIEPEVVVDCEAHCETLDDCRVPAEGCAAACAAGEVDLDRGGCVADARRAGGGCAAVAACVEYEPPPAGADCIAACGLQVGCDRGLDPYLCRLDCTPPSPALGVQLGCAGLLDCGRAFDDCFDLPADLDEDCVGACDGAAVCAGVFATDAACAARCTGQLATGLPLDGWADEIGACLGDAIDGDDCDEAAARECFAVGVRLGANQGFGHHGSCDTFNACRDARTCANAACAFHGHGEAISWMEGLCMDLNNMLPGGMDCDLFQALPNQLDQNWGGHCNIPVAYDIVCRP